jgi:hypothetical protein
MRLKKSRVAAEEELIPLLNEGYQILTWIKTHYHEAQEQDSFDSERDNQLYEDTVNEWGIKVVEALNSIFPTELEANSFLNPPPPPLGTITVGSDHRWYSLVRRLPGFIRALERVVEINLARYTDLPLKTRLYIEDIDSFRKVRDVNPAAVTHLLSAEGYLDQPEDFVQMALEQVLNVPFHKKDWGGEINDLYTANVIVNGSRTATAFLLKGHGLRRKALEIRDCGQNGDQLVRLFDSPAQLFVVQFVGEISENVIRDVEGKVNERRSRGGSAWYCIMNGQDTARLLHAYGKL